MSSAPPPPPAPWGPPEWAPPAQWSPPAPTATPARLRRRWVGGLAVVLVAGLLTGSSLAIGGDIQALPAVPVTTFLPDDGGRRLFSSSTKNEVVTSEVAHLPGATVLMSGPESFMTNGLSYDDAIKRFWVRFSTTRLSSSGSYQGRTDTLRSVGDAGLLTHVTDADDKGFFSFQPGYTELPVDVADGSDWTSEGTAHYGPGGMTLERSAAYRYQGSAVASANEARRRQGCLDVTADLTIGTGKAQRSTATWCPGVGKVAETTPEERLTGIDGFPAAADPAARVDTLDPPSSPQVIDASLTTLDTKTKPLLLTPGGPPSFGRGGGVVAHRNQGDLIGFTLGEKAITRTWRARPGGIVTAQQTFGDVTVACTSRREIAGYDRFGQWLWSNRIDDVCPAAPVRLDDGSAVLTLVDGTVLAFDLRTGQVLWERHLPTDVQIGPVVAARTVYVSDGGGHVQAIDAAGALRWETSLPDAVNLLAVVGDRLVGSASYAGRLYSLRLSDGSPGWEFVEQESRRQVLPMGQRAVVVTDERVFAISADGRELWSQPITGLALARERFVVVATADTVTALDADGSHVQTWTLPPHTTDPGTRWLGVSGDAIVLTDASFAMHVVGKK